MSNILWLGVLQMFHNKRKCVLFKKKNETDINKKNSKYKPSKLLFLAMKVNMRVETCICNQEDEYVSLHAHLAGVYITCYCKPSNMQMLTHIRINTSTILGL